MRLYYLFPLLGLAAVLSSNTFSRPPTTIRYARGLASVMNEAPGPNAGPLEAIRLGRAPAPACYDGTKAEACELLAAAIADRNAREKLDGRLSYKIEACEKNADGVIALDITGPEGATLVIPPIPRCS